MSQSFGQIPANAPLNDSFSGYAATTGATVSDGTVQTVNLDTEHFASSSTFDLDSNEVTVTEGGRYEIAFDVSALSTTGTRTQAECWLERNGVEVPGTRAPIYLRLTNMGGVGSGQVFIDLVADDVLRLRIQRTHTAGSFATRAQGSRLALRRL